MKRIERDDMDRLPPHDLEAEKSVLGCVLLEPKLLPEVRERLTAPEAFFDLRHAEVFAVMCALDEERSAVDLITIQARLRDAGKLEEVGGLAYLATLPDTVPSAANLVAYISILSEKWHARKLVRVFAEGSSVMMSGAGGVEEAGHALADRVREVNDSMTVAQAVKPMKDHVLAVAETLERTFEHRARGQQSPNTLHTPFEHLDRMTGGVHLAELTVIAARPGTGKTAMAMRMAQHFCSKQDAGVFFASAEMSAPALTERFLCQVSGCNLFKVHQGFIDDRDVPRLTTATAHVSRWAMALDDRRQTVAQFKAAVRRAAREGVHGVDAEGKAVRRPLKVVVFDYAQRARTGNRFHEERDWVNSISETMLDLALDHNIAAILLSQFNREFEKEKGKRKPRLSDLKDSGNLEQDAHTVLLNYPMPEPQNDPEKLNVWLNYTGMRCTPINTLIAKQRNGPSGLDVELVLRGWDVRMEDFCGGTGNMAGAERQAREWEVEWRKNA